MSDATRRRRGARAALRAAPPWTIALRVKRGRCGARRPHVAAPLRLAPSPFSRVPRCARPSRFGPLLRRGEGSIWNRPGKLLGFGGHGCPESGIRTAPTRDACPLPPRRTRDVRAGLSNTSLKRPAAWLSGCAAPASGQPRHAVPRGRRGRQGREAGRRRHPAHRPEGMCIYM